MGRQAVAWRVLPAVCDLPGKAGCGWETGCGRVGQACPCRNTRSCESAGWDRQTGAVRGGGESPEMTGSLSHVRVSPCPCTPAEETHARLHCGLCPCTSRGNVLVRLRCGVCQSPLCPPCLCCCGGGGSYLAPVPSDPILTCCVTYRIREPRCAPAPCLGFDKGLVLRRGRDGGGLLGIRKDGQLSCLDQALQQCCLGDPVCWV